MALWKEAERRIACESVGENVQHVSRLIATARDNLDASKARSAQLIQRFDGDLQGQLSDVFDQATHNLADVLAEQVGGYIDEINTRLRRDGCSAVIAVSGTVVTATCAAVDCPSRRS